MIEAGQSSIHAVWDLFSVSLTSDARSDIPDSTTLCLSSADWTRSPDHLQDSWRKTPKSILGYATLDSTLLDLEIAAVRFVKLFWSYSLARRKCIWKWRVLCLLQSCLVGGWLRHATTHHFRVGFCEDTWVAKRRSSRGKKSSGRAKPSTGRGRWPKALRTWTNFDSRWRTYSP